MNKTVVNELLRLHDQNGGLRPSEVVEAARDEDSVLHPQFEWDDEVAAHEHRLHQARALIRTVRVQVEGKAPRHVFCHLPNRHGEGTYLRTEIVAHSPDLLEQALAQFNRQIEALQRSADELLSMVQARAPAKTPQARGLRASLGLLRRMAEGLRAQGDRPS